MRANLADKPHVVYRAYSREGVLLYVGCSHNLYSRLTQHRLEQKNTPGRGWYALTQRVTFQDFPNGPSARQAEKDAIRSEHPLFNVNDSQRPAPELYVEPHQPPSVGRHERPDHLALAAAFS